MSFLVRCVIISRTGGRSAAEYSLSGLGPHAGGVVDLSGG